MNKPYNNAFDLIRQRAKVNPDKIFAIFPKEAAQISYQTLYRQALQYAQVFKQGDIKQGDLVLLHTAKSPALLFAYMGLLRLGAIAQCVDDKISGHDLTEMLQTLKPKTVYGLPPAHRTLPQFTSEHIVAENDLGKEPSLQDPAICVFTSGSTGQPKGIVASHANILFGASCLNLLKITPKDRALALTALSSINGQIFTLWTPLLSQSSVVFAQGLFSSYTACEWIRDYEVTWINGTPTHVALMTEYPVSRDEIDISRLRFFRSASAPLNSTLQERFEKAYGVDIINSMGLTEATGQVFSNPLNKEKRKLGSVGQPVQVQVRITDSEGNNRPSGAIGEIRIQSPGLMMGYLHDSDATTKTLENGWLKTGDLGYQDEEGFVFLHGRIKDIAIVGGQNVSLSEIDACLSQHPQIAFAACVTVPDKISGDSIWAYVVFSQDATMDSQALREYCLLHLTPAKCPVEFKSIAQLPLSSSGKILRVKLRDLALGERNAEKHQPV